MANPTKFSGVPVWCASKAKSPERQAEEMRQFAETDFAKDCASFSRGEMSAEAFRAKHFPNA